MCCGDDLKEQYSWGSRFDWLRVEESERGVVPSQGTYLEDTPSQLLQPLPIVININIVLAAQRLTAGWPSD